MNNIDFNEIISNVEKIPAILPIFMDLIDSFNNDNTELESIAQKIACDQVLTVKILRLANSPFYGMSHKIYCIQDAITILGFNSIRMLVATSILIDNFKSHQGHDLFSAFWRHSIGTAVCAHEIASTKHIKLDYAYIAGLIHDIGKLVLATQFSDQYKQVLHYQSENGCDSQTAEKKLLGVDHCEVGNALGNYWKFPEDLCLVISQHHTRQLESIDSLVAIIHLADIFATGLDLSDTQSDVVPKINPAICQKVELSEPDCQLVFTNTIKKFTAIKQVLLM